MKKFGRLAALFCMMAVLLAGMASANSAAPDYLVVVKMRNGPEEPYCLDLIAEGAGGGNGALEDAPDAELLEALRDAVPEGWYACTAEGTRYGMMEGELAGADGIHRFEGYDVPKQFRILVVTRSGEKWISDTLEREALQTGVRVDWETRIAKVPPIWGAYVLQFLSTLLPTLAFEGMVLLLFGYAWRKNWRVFLLVNLITQGLLTAVVSQNVVRGGADHYSMAVFFFFLIPAEAVIMLVEAGVYWKFLKGYSKGHAVGCAVTANLVSYVAGWFVVHSVWENITRAFWLGV